MELLDYRYADEKVRTMAVAAVERLINNDELDSFLLQLVQVQLEHVTSAMVWLEKGLQSIECLAMWLFFNILLFCLCAYIDSFRELCFVCKINL